MILIGGLSDVISGQWSRKKEVQTSLQSLDSLHIIQYLDKISDSKYSIRVAYSLQVTCRGTARANVIGSSSMYFSQHCWVERPPEGI